MKLWRGIVLGVLIGSLVSGGWWVYAAPIQSQVGIHGFTLTTWRALTTSAFDSTIVSESATPYGNLLHTAAVLYKFNTAGNYLERATTVTHNSISLSGSLDSNTIVSLLFGLRDDGSGSFGRVQLDSTNLDNICPTGCVGKLQVSSTTLGWDDAGGGAGNYDRIRTGSSGDNLTTGTLAVQLYGYDGTNFDRVRVDASGFLSVNCQTGCGSAGSSIPSDAFANPTTAFLNQSFNMLWNGATWDRQRGNTTGSFTVGNIADGAADSGNPVKIAGVDPNTALRQQLAVVGGDGYLPLVFLVGASDGVSNASISNLFTVAQGDNILKNAPHLFNGSTWDRARSGTTAADGQAAIATGSQNIRSFGYAFNGSSFDRVRTVEVGDGTTTGILAAGHMEYNGATHDRIRHSFTQTTAGVTTNAAGTSVNMTTTAMSKFTMLIDRTAGATNVVEIDLDCSIDNTDFVQIATITDLTNEPALTSQDGTPCYYMRYNVVTVGAGNTLQIHLLAVR